MTTHLRLVHAVGTKVLGEYDHQITFPADHDFAIIYGPNGVGKTKFLELIHGASRVDARALSSLPFESVTLSYDDGTQLHVQRQQRVDSDRSTQSSRPRFFLRRPHKKEVSWTHTGADFVDYLETTSWRQISTDLWEDRRDGEIASTSDLEERFGRPSASQLPQAFKNFVESAPTFLIETQRLKIENAPAQRGAPWRGSRPKNTSRISEQASTMRSLINEAQTEHSRITQQLDRTFPNRILSSEDQNILAEESIRQQYTNQNEFRSRLGRVASVALEEALSLPSRPLVDWERQLLSLYLEDAYKKLDPFEVLLQKIELLENIVSSRLLSKRLQVTADEGFRVIHQRHQRDIDLDSLSSGEQHEIILMFDLLFNVPSGALVMIDEPEISLHVVWQLAFLPDVKRIAELAGFRFMVATHSPQIINDSWNRAIRLGPEDADFQ